MLYRTQEEYLFICLYACLAVNLSPLSNLQGVGRAKEGGQEPQGTIKSFGYHLILDCCPASLQNTSTPLITRPAFCYYLTYKFAILEKEVLILLKPTMNSLRKNMLSKITVHLHKQSQNCLIDQSFNINLDQYHVIPQNTIQGIKRIWLDNNPR